MKKAILKLKDGKEFEGIAFGAPINLECSEVVFNTGTPGYEEILTDPSYKVQIVVLTSPMIGNYGITVKDGESSGVKSTALIIKKLYRGTVMPSRLTLDEYLKKEGIPALEGVDTRALTIHLRENGSQNGILFYEEERKEAEEKLDSYPEITEIELCTNNDLAGRMAAEAIGKQYEKSYQIIRNLPQKEGADYGDLAKEQREKIAEKKRGAYGKGER